MYKSEFFWNWSLARTVAQQRELETLRCAREEVVESRKETNFLLSTHCFLQSTHSPKGAARYAIGNAAEFKPL